MKLPAYIWRNRHGTFYFRAVIPSHLLTYFPNNRRELRRSLSTDSRRVAIRRARAYRVEFDKLLERIDDMAKKKKNSTFRTGLIEDIELDLGDGRSLKIGKIDHDGDHEKEKETLRATVEAATANKSNQAAIPGSEDTAPLSLIIDDHCTEQVQAGNWKPKTEHENRAIYALLLNIVGDKPIGKIDHAIMRHYKSILRKLPANMNKARRYRDKSIEEILAMPDVKPMSSSTINKNLGRTSTLFDWAVKHGYMSQNFAEGLTIKIKKRADQQRDAFTADELQTLLNGYLYQGQFPPRTRPHNYQFWLPIMGMFTGARIEELCKLRLDDITKVDGVWCLDTGVKTEAGVRLIPIHNRLIDLGLIEYADSLREKNNEYLFPELRKERDGHSQAASKWFARYRERYGIGGRDGKKCFHSLRHNVLNALKQRGDIPREQAAAIAGHKDDSMTFGRYGKAYQPSSLQKVVNAIEYSEVDFSHISFEDFQRRKAARVSNDR